MDYRIIVQQIRKTNREEKKTPNPEEIKYQSPKGRKKKPVEQLLLSTVCTHKNGLNYLFLD